ncbi:MAG: monovalent cation/H+ antiporter complex subunit F [Pleomorphochaeta sp.]
MTNFILSGMRYFLIVFATITIIRLLIGPSASDRLIAMNVLSAIALALLILWGVTTKNVLYLDVALVYDIFGFLGFLAITRFLKNTKDKL